MSSSSSAVRRLVGIVGAGYVSTYHIRALQGLGEVEVVAIADPNLEQARRIAKQFEVKNVYASLAEMAAAHALHSVHILTPPAFHAPIALEAMELGLHVLVEKPMAESVADCDRMIAKAREKGVHLSVNHSARLDPVILEAIERVQGGEIGDLLSVDFLRSSDYPPYLGGPMPAPYRKGSYPFQDLGVHALYLLEAFLGEIETAEIDYRSSGRDLNLIYDEWTGTVSTRRGMGRFYISWNVRPVQNRLIVNGTKGIMEVDCFLQTCVTRKAWPGPRPGQWVLNAVIGSAQTAIRSVVNIFRFATKSLRPSPGIFAGAELFQRALANGTPPPVSAEEGRRMVALMEEVSARADADRAKLLEVSPAALPARVLVTGGNGFLGSAVVRKLQARNERLRLLVRRPGEAEPNIDYFIGDLGRPEVVDAAVSGVEVVYHIGAAMKGSAGDFTRGTMAGTRNVIDACVKHGVKRLIYVSSLSVLDHAGRNPSEPVVEGSPYEPYPERRGAYTQTKLDAERMVLDAVREHQLPAVILRPGQIFGPGGALSAPSGAIGLAGRWVIVGNGTRHLPLVYVDDVACAMLEAETAEVAAGSIYHLVDPTPLTQRQYVAAAHRAHPERVKAIYLPEWLMMLVGLGVELLGKVLGRAVPLTRYRIKSIRPLYPVNTQAAERDLRWKPSVGVREGIERTFVFRR